MTTVMEDAFARAGMKKHQTAIGLVCQNFIRQGGTLEEWVEVFKQSAEQMRRRGHLTPADVGQPRGANPSRQIASAGRLDDGEKPRMTLPAAREPSPTSIAAVAKIKNAVAITVLDRAKTSDGRPWGDVGAHELDGMDRDGKLARAIKSRLGVLTNADRFKTMRELMTPKQFEECREEVKRHAHA